MSENDITFEELDRMVQTAHTRKRKPKRAKKATKKATKPTSKPKKSTPSAHKKKAVKKTPPAEKPNHAKDTKSKPKTHAPTKHRSVARSARTMHAKTAEKPSAKRVKRARTESHQPKLAATTEHKPTRKIAVKTSSKKHTKPHKKPAPRPIDLDKTITSTGTKRKSKSLVTDSPMLFNRTGTDTKARAESEVKVKVGASSPPKPKKTHTENKQLLSKLATDATNHSPHTPVGQQREDRIDAGLDSLYDDATASVDESAAKAKKPVEIAEPEPEAITAKPRGKIKNETASVNSDVQAKDDELTELGYDMGAKAKVDVLGSDHHKIKPRRGWVTALDHLLNIVITTLFLVLLAIFIFMQMGWFGLQPLLTTAPIASHEPNSVFLLEDTEEARRDAMTEDPQREMPNLAASIAGVSVIDREQGYALRRP